MKCKNCGQKFKPKKSNQRFCSKECRISYWKQNKSYIKKNSVKKAYDESNEIPCNKICVKCKKLFVSTDNSKSYCSKECEVYKENEEFTNQVIEVKENKKFILKYIVNKIKDVLHLNKI